MGFEREVIIRARARHQEQVDLHRRTLRERTASIYEEIPRIKEINDTLATTAARIMTDAFRSGFDPHEAAGRVRAKNDALLRERSALLRSSGYSADYLDDGPLCRKCSDYGYIGTAMCECLERLCLEEQRKMLTSLLSSRSSSFDEFSLDYYSDVVDPAYGISPRQQMEIVYETCVNYARKFSVKSRSLLLNGGPGLGKTFLSACIAHQVVMKGYSVVYDSAIRIFSAMEHQRFGSSTEEENRLVERVMACDLLILDDLGTEMTTTFVTSALYSVVDGRILEGKPCIISTNLTMGELARRYSPQIASRLLGEYINLVFLGQDIRPLRG